MTVDIIETINLLMAGFKDVQELQEKQRYAEVKKGIADMAARLSDMKLAFYEIRDENTELKEQIKKMTVLSEKKLTLKYGLYYDENGEGPYCPNCWNNDKRLLLMTEFSSGKHACATCKTLK
jgi:hypothetical protein